MPFVKCSQNHDTYSNELFLWEMEDKFSLNYCSSIKLKIKQIFQEI